MDLVSIITPLYNSENFVEEMILSVLNQTYSNWELIIVDDASTDKSAGIVNEYILKDNRIQLIPLDKNHRHPAHARNIAIQNAKGRFISFLDSDDTWESDKLEKQINFIQSHKNCHIVFSAYEKMDESGIRNNRVVNIPQTLTYKDLLKTNSIGCLTAMYDQLVIGKVFQKTMIHEDYIMWLEILRKGYIAYGMNSVLALYRVRKQSVSNDKLKVARVQWKIYREVEQLKLIPALYYFGCYTFYGFKKKFI